MTTPNTNTKTKQGNALRNKDSKQKSTPIDMDAIVNAIDCFPGSIAYVSPRTSPRQKVRSSPKLMKALSDGNFSFESDPIVKVSALDRAFTVHGEYARVARPGVDQALAIAKPVAGVVTNNAPTVFSKYGNQHQCQSLNTFLALNHSVRERADMNRLLNTKVLTLSSFHDAQVRTRGLMRSVEDAKKAYDNYLAACYEVAKLVKGFDGLAITPRGMDIFPDTQPEDLDPIVAQGNLPREVENYKIMARCLEASPYKGLGKFRVKRFISKSKAHRTPESSYRECDKERTKRLNKSREMKVAAQGATDFLSGIKMPDVSLKMDDELRNCLNDLTSLLARVEVNGFTHHIKTGFMETMRSLAPSKTTSAKYLFILLVAVIIHHNLKNSPVKWAACASAFLVAVNFIIEDSKLKDYLARLLQSDDLGIQAQGGYGFDLPSIIVGYVYAAFFRDVRTTVDPITSFFKKAGDMPKIKNGITEFVNYCIGLIQSFLDFLTDLFRCDRIRLRSHPHPEVLDLYDEVNKFADSFLSGRNYDYDAGVECRHLVQKHRTIEADLSDRTPEGKEAKEVAKKIGLVLSRIQSRLQRSNISGNGCRIPPLGILIAGPSKMGKTHLMTTLINRVTALVVPEHLKNTFAENHNAVTFTRANETHFWDGYHGHFNCYIDDLGQLRDVAGNAENEYMEVIRAIGPNDYPLNMATLEDKGAVNFTSRLVWATTNRKLFILNSLISSEAFCRRFTQSYIMTCAPEFAVDPNEKDPWARRIKRYPSDLNDKSHLEFYKFDPETGVYSGPPISYEELVENIVSAYEDIEVNGKKMLEAQLLDKAVALEERERRRARAESDDGTDEKSSLIRYSGVRAQCRFDTTPDTWKHKTSHSGALFEACMEEVEFNLMAGAGDPPEGSTLAQHLMSELGVDWPLLKSRYETWAGQHDPKFLGHIRPNTMDEWLGCLMTPRERLRKFPINFFSGVKHTMIDIWEKNVDFFKKRYDGQSKVEIGIDIVKKALSAFLIVWGTASIVSGLMGNKPSAESYGGSVKSLKAYRTRAADGKGYRLVPSQLRIYAQSNIDDNCVDIAQKVIRGSQYLLFAERHASMGVVTFVKGDVAIAPLHFGEALLEWYSKGNPKCWIAPINTPEVKTEFNILDLEIGGIDDLGRSDICGIRFKGLCQQKPDIIKYFFKGEQDPSHKRFDVLLPIFRDKSLVIHSMRANALEEVVPYSDGKYEITSGYKYDLYTMNGDCGSLLFNCDSTISRGKIIGFHVAGSRSHGGFSLHISQETVRKIYECITADNVEYMCETDLDEFPVVQQSRGFENFVVEGNDRKVHTPTETKIKKSPLHGVYAPSLQRPALLRPTKVNGEVVDPMEKARIKYAPDTIIKPALMEKMASNLIAYNLQDGADFGAPWAKPRVFSFEEACEGVPGVEFADAIPRNTSCGYPWALEKPPSAKGKQHIFGEADAFDYSNKYAVAVRARVDEIISKAAEGKRLRHIYMDFLKDELRPHEKVDACKTRMISACPVDFAIAFRMYFLDFMRWFMHNRIRNGSAVGVNPYCVEWTLIVKTLRAQGTDTIAGDYSGYDASTTAQDLASNIEIINDWYGGDERDTLIRKVLWLDVMLSRHISGDVVYQWRGSMPSGTPPTTISNSMTNMKHILMSYIYLYCEFYNADHGYLAYADAIAQFQRDVRYQVYGDDNLIVVHNESQEFYNQMTITVGMKKIGCNYTNEMKTTDNAARFRVITEVGFLKRGFSKNSHDGTYLCPLELNTILEMPQWVKDKKDADLIVRDNVNNAIRELSLHPKYIYDYWAPKILTAARERLDYIPEFTDWGILRSLVLKDPQYQRFL